MINLEGVNKGDRVKIETYAGDTAEFTVVDAKEWALYSESNTYPERAIKSVEVIQKPLPTEPGMYRAADGESRVFILKGSEKWVIYYTKDHSLIEQSAEFVAKYFHNFTRIEL